MSGLKCGSNISQKGEIKAIRDYCETDALNTYLVYLHWQHVKGNLTDSALQQEHQVIKAALSGAAPHLDEFLKVWQG